MSDNWIETELYPSLFRSLDRVLPEFGFVKRGENWQSTTGRKATGEDGAVGKVFVYANAPFCLKDWTRDSIDIIGYVAERDRISRKEAIKVLSEIVGLRRSVERRNFLFTRGGKRTTSPKESSSQNTEGVQFIPLDLLEKQFTPSKYEQNNFVLFLREKFGTARAKEIVERYYIATSSYWDNAGATLFLQIDACGNIRQAKVILYDVLTGKRRKDMYVGKDGKESPYSKIIGNLIRNKGLMVRDSNLTQCLFGEHLVSDNSKTIAIVESEKSACIASLYFPQFIWIATGGKENFKLIRNCRELVGRDILLFPDVDGFWRWSKEAAELQKIGIKAQVSTWLRDNAPAEDVKGDIADYLLTLEVAQFLCDNAQNPIE